MELSFEKAGSRLTMDYVLSCVSDEMIYRRYSDGFPKRSMHSPFREDPNPSFGFFVKRGKWQWKDNATGEGGDVFDFVAKLCRTNLEGALADIANSFCLESEQRQYNAGSVSSYSSEKQKRERSRSLIQVVSRPFSELDVYCWSRFGISPLLLNAFKIRVASEVWLKKEGWGEKKCIWKYEPNNPIFYWLSPYSNNIKCYRPMETNKRYKWLSNMDDATDIQGYLQLDIKRNAGKPLLLVKSMKEIAFFRSFGYLAIAQNAEGYIINADFIRHIKKYCFPILSLYDRDAAGVLGMVRLKKEYKIPGLVMPNWGAKDPTDLWLKDYKRVYKLLNLIDEYFEFIRRNSGVDDYSFGFHYS